MADETTAIPTATPVAPDPTAAPATPANTGGVSGSWDTPTATERFIHSAATAVHGAVKGAVGMGKEILFPEGPTEIEKIKDIARKLVIDPAAMMEMKARTAKTSAESIGYSIAEGIPLIGPYAAQAAEQMGTQAGSGDVAGAAGTLFGNVVAARMGAKIAEKIGGVTPEEGPKVSTETKLGPQAPPAGEEPLTEMNRETVTALQDLGYANKDITQFNIGEIRRILKDKIPAAEPEPEAAAPAAPAAEAPKATAADATPPDHITFDSLGGTEVKAPTARPAEDVMVRPEQTSRATPTGAGAALPAEIHADLEKQAGRTLSNEEAVALDRANLERGMVSAPEGDTGAIREQKRSELEQAGRLEEPATISTAEALQGGHAGGGVASVEELARPGRFVKVSRSGQLTDQGKTPDFTLRPGEVGYQVKPDGTATVVDGQETPAHQAAIERYTKEVFPTPKPEFEQTLARRGQLPNQTVNMSDAYGDTGKYVGGLGPKLRLGSEDAEDQLLTSEQQSPLREPYSINVTDRDGTNHTESVAAFSNKEALKTAKKQFPEASEWGVESSKARTPSTEYMVPTGKHLSMPASEGRDVVESIRHELGHAMEGQAVGMTQKGMLRHTHSSVPRSARASVSWDARDLFGSTGRIKPEHVPAVIRNFMGGIAADEVFNNVPRSANHNLNVSLPGSDGNQAYKILTAAGYTLKDAVEYMHKMIDTGVEHLSHPAVSSIIHENEGTREAGLSRQYHFSPERLQNMHTESQRRIQHGPEKYDNGAIDGESAPGRATDVPTGEGGSAQSVGSGIQKEIKTAETRKTDDELYQGLHRPPGPPSGAPLHDLTGGGTVYPDDVYGPNALRYYGTGDAAPDRESLSVIHSMHNKPNGVVTMYRAVPRMGNINSGDWVTISRTYAKQHGESTLHGDYHIISKRVKASTLFTNGGSLHEFGYWPKGAEDEAISPQLETREVSEPEKKPFEGLHFSPVERDTLLGSERGAAAAGEEKNRLQHENAVPGIYAYRRGVTPEPQIGSRRYQYEIGGNKAIAEIGEGGAQHDLLQSAVDKAQAKYKAAGDNDTVSFQKALNDGEAAIRDAGYDGYERGDGSVFLYGDHKPTGKLVNYTGAAVRAPLPEDLSTHEIRKETTKDMTPEIAQKIVDLHTANGGSTYNLTHGDLAGTDNYAVSTNPERGQVLGHPPTAKDIQDFVAKNADLLKNPEKSIGTWLDTSNNTHALDVVSTIPDREKAIALGVENNQKAIFHLKTNTEIPTGGTGAAREPGDDDEPSSKTTALPFEKQTPPKQLTGPAKGATTPLMKNPLAIEGTGTGGRTTIVDLAGALNQWAQAGLKPKKEIQVALDRARAEMTYQLANDNSGLDWYKKDTKDAIDHLKANGFPELEKPLQDKLFRVLWGGHILRG